MRNRTVASFAALSPFASRASCASLVVGLCSLSACGGAEPAPPATPAPATQPPAPAAPAAVVHAVRHDAIDRLAFNRLAVRLNLPLYWASDTNKNGIVEPNEVAALLFYPT